MAFAGNHHRNLHVTETTDMIESVSIFGNIDDLIGNAYAVERAIGGGALDAGGFAVNGDGVNGGVKTGHGAEQKSATMAHA